MFLTSIPINAIVNISVSNYSHADWRNSIQWGRALIDVIGRDSAYHSLSLRETWSLWGEIDSLGHIKKIITVFRKNELPDGTLVREKMSECFNSKLEYALRKNNATFTMHSQPLHPFTVDQMLIQMESEKNPLKFLVSWPNPVSYLYFDKTKEIDPDEILNKTLGNIWSYIPHPHTSNDAPQKTPRIDHNSSVFLISLIYIIGEYNVAKFLSERPLKMTVSVNADGKVMEILSLEGVPNQIDKKTIKIELMRLYNINNIRFQNNAAIFEKTPESTIQIEIPRLNHASNSTDMEKGLIELIKTSEIVLK